MKPIGALIMSLALWACSAQNDRAAFDYAKVDVTASWRAHDHVTLLLVVENLFDADFEEAIGFPDVGIYPRLGVRVVF